MMVVRGGFCNGSFTGRSFGCGAFSRQSERRLGCSGIDGGEWDRMGIKCPKRYYPSGGGRLEKLIRSSEVR